MYISGEYGYMRVYRMVIVQELLPLWKHQQTLKLQEKIKDLRNERTMVEDRRQKFASAGIIVEYMSV